jgi:hypothetical protein
VKNGTFRQNPKNFNHHQNACSVNHFLRYGKRGERHVVAKRHRVISAGDSARTQRHGERAHHRSLSSAQRQLYNLDGKVVCGSVDKASDNQLHLLALQESEANLVIEQTELEKGENEISAAKRLLEKVDLENKIVKHLAKSNAVFRTDSFQHFK